MFFSTFPLLIHDVYANALIYALRAECIFQHLRPQFRPFPGATLTHHHSHQHHHDCRCLKCALASDEKKTSQRKNPRKIPKLGMDSGKDLEKPGEARGFVFLHNAMKRKWLFSWVFGVFQLNDVTQCHVLAVQGFSGGTGSCEPWKFPGLLCQDTPVFMHFSAHTQLGVGWMGDDLGHSTDGSCFKKAQNYVYK